MGNTNQSALASTGPAWLAGAMGHVLRWAVVPAAAIGTLAGVGVVTGGVGGAAVSAALANPLSVLAARSPGARAPGALTQTKPRRTDAPEERALSTALTRPLDRFAAPGLGGGGPAASPAPVGDAVDQAVAQETPAPDVAIATTTIPGSLPGGFIGTPGGIVVTPGGGGGGSGSIGGGGGGGGGSTTTPTTPVTPTNPVEPVASVPEPGTWLTLLIGFGAVGGALRSRRRALPSAG